MSCFTRGSIGVLSSLALLSFASIGAAQIGPAPTNPTDPAGATGTAVPTAAGASGVGGQAVLVPAVVPAPPVIGTGGVTPPPRISLGAPPNPATANPAGSSAPEMHMPEALQVRPGGLTADGAARRALAGFAPAVAAAQANVMVARAAQAEAARSMLPQLSASFRYTRLSTYTPGMLPVFDTAGCLQNIARCQMNPQSFQTTVALGTAILDQWGLRVTLTLPLSDVPLRILPNYQAAGYQAESAELYAEAARQQTALEAREAFYEFARAQGQAWLMEESLATAQRRHGELGQAVAAGVVARSDLLRLEATIADLQRLSVLAHNAVGINEALLRQRLHLAPEESFLLGESLVDAPPFDVALPELIQRAQLQRAEVQAIDRQRMALDRSIAATRASQFPSLAAVGNMDYANPNSRFFPQTPEFRATWDATLSLSWNMTQAFVADATIDRIRAQQAALQAQQRQLREGLEMQVRQFYMAAQAAYAQVEASRSSLASAEETLRVRRERMRAGAAVQSDVSDAETELLRARLNAINAVIDARLALARLRRAVGEREAQR